MHKQKRKVDTVKMYSRVREVKRARGAIAELTRQLETCQTANKRKKLWSRINTLEKLL